MSYLETAKQSLKALRGDQVHSPCVSRFEQFTVLDPTNADCMTIDAFAVAKMTLVVESTPNGQRAIFASDDIPPDEVPEGDMPVYRAAELRKLAVLSPFPGTVQTLGQAKAIICGKKAEFRGRYS